MQTTERISLADAETLIFKALVAAGVVNVAALAVAKALVAAEADGQPGHGFSRLGDYLGQVRSGKIKAQAQIVTVADSDTAILTNADCGFAYPALDVTIAQGIRVAKARGMAAMSVFNSHHCGSLAFQVQKLADAGLIGLMCANAPKAIAPWGGKAPVFGTNPIAFAAPRQGQPPLVIDLSLSKVARGKVMHAKKMGTPIPEGWALDKDGQPTTDPQAALEGTMLPIGGAKGTALALMVEILAAALTGSAFSHEAGSFFTAEGTPPRVGQFLLAIDPGKRMPDFLARLEVLLTEISAQEGARLPGMRRLQSQARATAEGIEVPKAYLDLARAAAAGTA